MSAPIDIKLLIAGFVLLQAEYRHGPQLAALGKGYKELQIKKICNNLNPRKKNLLVQNFGIGDRKKWKQE